MTEPRDKDIEAAVARDIARELDALTDREVDLTSPLTGYPPDDDPLGDGEPLGDTSDPMGG